MDDVRTTESTLQTPDNVVLYTKTWHSTLSPTKARLVFLHGFSDHCNFYDPLFEILATHGITTYSFDQRGWGRSVHSKAERGLTGSTAQVLADITHFIRNLPTTNHDSTTPLFLAGHSMGGGEVLHYAATGPTDITRTIRGYLLEAPFCGFHPSSTPNKLTLLLGRLASHLLPHRQMINKLDPSGISRDPAIRARWLADPLNHDTGTLQGLTGLLDRASQLESGAVRVPADAGEGVQTRLWVAHGTHDTLAGVECTRRMFAHHAHVRDKELRVYEGWAHKLHMEPGEDKRVFAEDMAGWMLDRCGDLGEGVRAKL